MTVFLVVVGGLWLLGLSGATVVLMVNFPPHDERSTRGHNVMFAVQALWVVSAFVLLVLAL